MPNYIEKRIGEFKAGDAVCGYFFVKESELKTTTTNNKYMNFCFADQTGEINAKLWDWDEENAVRFKAGILVYGKGTVVDWQGQLQFKLDLLRRTIDTDPVRLEDYIPSAPYSGESMLHFIETCVDQMKDAELQKLVRAVLEQYRDRLLFYPAAKKNHHAVRCGLLYHTATMLKSAVALSKIYTFLNTDLLYAGVILHDLGKIAEMAVNECGLVTEYTTEGMLLGHLVQGVKHIEIIGQSLQINPEKILLIQHMLLSHHYIPEHGSPKSPAFPEAELLHYLDIVDARMYDMQKAIESTEPGTFSDRIWSLENRSIYKNQCF